MMTTLIFPSYLQLAGFMAVADNANIEMDIRKKSLSANFNEAEIALAIKSFAAQIIPVVR